jgi:hypothetical protein
MLQRRIIPFGSIGRWLCNKTAFDSLAWRKAVRRSRVGQGISVEDVLDRCLGWMADWIPVATNAFDGVGRFSFTNTPDAGKPQQFFIIQFP